MQCLMMRSTDLTCPALSACVVPMHVLRHLRLALSRRNDRRPSSDDVSTLPFFFCPFCPPFPPALPDWPVAAEAATPSAALLPLAPLPLPLRGSADLPAAASWLASACPELSLHGTIDVPVHWC